MWNRLFFYSFFLLLYIYVIFRDNDLLSCKANIIKILQFSLEILWYLSIMTAQLHFTDRASKRLTACMFSWHATLTRCWTVRIRRLEFSPVRSIHSCRSPELANQNIFLLVRWLKKSEGCEVTEIKIGPQPITVASWEGCLGMVL